MIVVVDNVVVEVVLEVVATALLVMLVDSLASSVERVAHVLPANRVGARRVGVMMIEQLPVPPSVQLGALFSPTKEEPVKTT